MALTTSSAGESLALLRVNLQFHAESDHRPVMWNHGGDPEIKQGKAGRVNRITHTVNNKRKNGLRGGTKTGIVGNVCCRANKRISKLKEGLDPGVASV